VILLPGATADDPVRAALGNFTNSDPVDFLRRLQAQRLPPITPEVKQAVLDSFPKQGRLTKLSPAGQHKVSSLEQVLHIHNRRGVYEVIVMELSQAFTGLVDRTILVISDTALAVLEKEELQAVVAHEVGHEYVWQDYYAAYNSRRWARLQELELYCDGIAILTLLELNETPRRLSAAFGKIAATNRRFGLADNQARYPTLAERKRFADALIRWAEQ
jgi:hypothetical protein